ncbi:MAG: hypothetical protein IM584_01370 [Chitinophagaceae bacterium]|nr:hypothetical protein [Chitinophagaceae bacterium]MCA6453303.1 hypothetical protein [Chitinophagaceae bacterium]MCA6454762.1 hypothetical protein [Chitinophagaceae bacterium]MCA6459445.1 hypothetical protein [Chitinophagaceae bacterium]MCA6464751.1 hypothetical protein [Chitinophagaceae bacterium]
MKRLIAISFLSIYLFSTTEMYQLVKLPLLVEHFIEHKQKKSDLTLWEFLCLHYKPTTEKDSDYAKDMKLPFKSHDGCINAVIGAFVPNNHSTEIHKPVTINSRHFPLLDETFTGSSFLSTIWQPPKNC